MTIHLLRRSRNDAAKDMEYNGETNGSIQWIPRIRDSVERGALRTRLSSLEFLEV